MEKDVERLLESKAIIHKIANGINPLSNVPIENEGFLNDPRIIRSLFFLVDYIDSELSMVPLTKRSVFFITEAQKLQVMLPDEEIGINDLAKALNEVIDTRLVKRISGTVINKQLKKMGILSEEKTEDGKIRTVTNEKSEGYGIVSRVRYFDNRQYEQVLFTDLGKIFVLDNLERILEY
jgi:hypothetical protein